MFLSTLRAIRAEARKIGHTDLLFADLSDDLKHVVSLCKFALTAFVTKSSIVIRARLGGSLLLWVGVDVVWVLVVPIRASLTSFTETVLFEVETDGNTVFNVGV